MWKATAVALAIVWVGFLAYLLLVSDPPDFWFDDIGTVDGPGHLVGGVVTGGGGVPAVGSAARAPGVAALGSTLVLLLGLEFASGPVHESWLRDLRCCPVGGRGGDRGGIGPARARFVTRGR